MFRTTGHSTFAHVLSVVDNIARFVVKDGQADWVWFDSNFLSENERQF